jgi:Na+/proline symporter
MAVLSLAALALGLWLIYSKTLVDLLLFYYNGITQLMPGLIFGLVWRRVPARAIAAGIAGGLLTVLTIFYEHADPTPWGVNIGLLALVVNVVIVVAITLVWPRKDAAVEVSG